MSNYDQRMKLKKEIAEDEKALAEKRRLLIFLELQESSGADAWVYKGPPLSVTFQEGNSMTDTLRGIG